MYRAQDLGARRKLMKPCGELNRTPVLVLYWVLNVERRRSFDKSEERCEFSGRKTRALAPCASAAPPCAGFWANLFLTESSRVSFR